MLHWVIARSRPTSPAEPFRARHPRDRPAGSLGRSLGRAQPGAALLLAGALLAGCASTGAAPSASPPAPAPATGSSAPGPLPAAAGSALEASTVPGTSTPSAPSAGPADHGAPSSRAWTATTISPEPLPPAAPPCPNGAGAHDRLTPGAQAAPVVPPVLAAPLAELQRTAGTVSIAITDVGAPFASGPTATAVTRTPLVAVDAERATVPASNQKLLIGAAVLEAEGADAVFTTRVVSTAPVVDGTVHGDLVLVAGGDPTLTSGALPAGADAATRSAPPATDGLIALATQIRQRGITAVDGRVLIDERRFDQQRYAAAGPVGNVGPLSALVVDRNRGADVLTSPTDPALAHGHRLVAALQEVGVHVGADVASVGADTGPAAGEVVASLQSPPLRDIVAVMLARSDNLYAEVLTKDLGFRTGGPGKGTTADGLAAARRIVAGLCVAMVGTDADGSGLSLANRRTAGGIERLLEVAMTRPWWPAFRDALAVAGRSGTLATRMTTGAAAGQVRAKSGSVGHARALSGYVPAAEGHTVVFSILVDNATADAEKAIDIFVTALATAT